MAANFEIRRMHESGPESIKNVSDGEKIAQAEQIELVED
jgi:hypothetical protein